MHIIVDDREPHSIVEVLRHDPSTDVVVQRLPVGDFLVDRRVLIERKTVQDLVSAPRPFEGSS